jgi:hypothetical protein
MGHSIGLNSAFFFVEWSLTAVHILFAASKNRGRTWKWRRVCRGELENSCELIRGLLDFMRWKGFCRIVFCSRSAKARKVARLTNWGRTSLYLLGPHCCYRCSGWTAGALLVMFNSGFSSFSVPLVWSGWVHDTLVWERVYSGRIFHFYNIPATIVNQI